RQRDKSDGGFMTFQSRLMRSICCSLAMAAVLAIASQASAQVAVTNPGNTTPGLAAAYGSLAAAITDLNAQTAISGPVIITLTGNETAPAGSGTTGGVYIITGSPSTLGASAANNVLIEGSASNITSS